MPTSDKNTRVNGTAIPAGITNPGNSLPSVLTSNEVAGQRGSRPRDPLAARGGGGGFSTKSPAGNSLNPSTPARVPAAPRGVAGHLHAPGAQMSARPNQEGAPPSRE